MANLCRILAYVRHTQIDGYLREGWMVLDTFADCYHGQFAVLMGWPCECDVRLPKRGAA